MPDRQGNTHASGRRESRRRFFRLLEGLQIGTGLARPLPPSRRLGRCQAGEAGGEGAHAGLDGNR